MNSSNSEILKKSLVLSLIVCILFGMFTNQVYAFDEDEHNEYMEYVLFGDKNYSESKKQDISEKIDMLEAASYLCIDQAGENGKDKLTLLINAKVKKLPEFDSFKLTGVFMGSHRNYTHRGWDYTYIIEKGKKTDKANWPARKNILRSTVNKIFDFGFMNELFGKYCDKCDSFSALVYYIHVLGDLIEATSYKTKDLTVPLARASAGVDKDTFDLLSELQKHIKILFADQTDSYTYKALTQEIDTIAEEGRKLVGTQGGINTDEKFKEYHDLEEKLMDVLANYIPILLRNEKFFSDVFK